MRGVLLTACLGLSVAACAPKLMKLPAPGGASASDARDALAQATDACRSVTTMSAEIGVSGSVGGQRLRGRLLVGVAAPASARIEAIAPFGQPVFIFVARGGDATLLLPRDDRVLEHGKPEAVLAAVTGLPLDAADLRMALTGCIATPQATDGRTAGDDWRIVTVDRSTVYLHRDRAAAPWQLVAVDHKPTDVAEWRAEYRDHQNGQPRSVRLVSRDAKRFDLRLTLSQVELNTTLGADVFRVEIPPRAVPISLRELEEAGPLRASERSGGKASR